MESIELEKILKDSFRLDSFRRGQREILDSVLSGNDVLAVLPTGSGKSLCYQLPAIQQQKLVVVISPLIALMKDQVQALKKLGLRAGCFYSEQTFEEKKKVFSDIDEGGAFVLYLSPERVAKEGFQKWIMNRPIATFAVDEAHCVSQWGHDFRSEYTQLRVLKQLRPDVPVMALTASATPVVLKDIAKHLQLKNPDRKVYGFYRPNLYYQVELCDSEDDKLHMLLGAIRHAPQGRKLIYCGTRKWTDQVAKYLTQSLGVSVEAYHAGLKMEERTRIQDEYTNDPDKILVATNAFGMGMDQSNVRLVVHFQLPSTIDALYQEMGRAGRDEKPSTCLLLFLKADKALQSFFIRSSDAPAEVKSLRWNNLDALVNYAEGSECRHGEVLTYYRDTNRIEKCGHCDNCDPSSGRRVPQPEESTHAKFTVDKKSKKIKIIKKKSSAASKDIWSLDNGQQQLFDKLKAWRKGKAQELDMPAFVVFSDRTLRALASANPQSIDQLTGIHGIGEAKLERFGKELMQVLQET